MRRHDTGTVRRLRLVPLVLALLAPLALAGTAHAGGADPVRDLGTPLTSLTVMQGAVGHDPDGSDVLYAVPAGENAELNVVDVHSRTLKRAVPLPGAAGAWAITVASDGSVYVGSYSNAHLYRYTPADGTVTDLGQPIGGEQFLYGLSAGDDGSVYGGTYPHAHAFRYDPADGQVTDYGSLDDVQQYARSTAYDPDDRALFVGLATPKARLLRIDVDSGAVTELTPAGFGGTELSDLDYAGGKVFGNDHGQLVVFDAKTGNQLDFTDPSGATVDQFPLSARGVSPAHDGAVWFTTSTLHLVRYDLATDTLTDTGARVSRGAAIGYGWVDDPTGPALYGLAGNYSGGTFRFDPATNALTQWSSPLRYVPVPLMNVLPDPTDGTVLVDAFLNGTAGRYDPATGKTAAAPRLGQVEDWAWGDDGKVYFGIYPYGQLSVWDPHAPAGADNPRKLFALVDSDEQNRPVAVVPHGRRVYVGTTPGYGVYGGALSVYDLDTGELAVHRNIVPDQTVASLLPVGDAVWGGSSIDGGQGTEPKATEAKLFRYDPATGTRTAEYTPVPGAESITALTVGPDHDLWGLADGTVFVFDPDTHQVVRRIPVFTGGTGAQDGALVWRDGMLYGVSGGRLFVVDSLGGTARVLHSGGLLRLAPAADGTLYTLLQPAGSVDRTHLAAYTPPADACPSSDLRGTVWAGDVDSGVPNRFVGDGCTVTDRLPDPDANWPNHGSYVAAVTSSVDALVDNESVTPDEGDRIVAAAARSAVS
ncbi:hypothetical protein Athai_52160 [Actinocatenispora thailandica]|uniref:DUF6923 domain-containing protein n=1 Tax=Actinocatenispora thailandica TaxID=227318 RepID=A0A7R7HZ13_9ACTN|nr:hypothetical protein [Actinocatenispora thailandica]BCJ37713.1 hypothetical protein Athai_52160 [Actinocatenispora thailandica]